MTLKEKTREEDERLRKELENAAIEKLKKAIRVALSPVRGGKKRSKTLPR